MKDKEFKKMDENWMKKMEPLREKEVSEGMLKGFSTSVERRITAREETVKKSPVLRPAWVSTLAVLVLASLVAVRSPELTQPSSDDEVQEEIELLKELGAWDESEEEALIGEEELLVEEGLA